MLCNIPRVFTAGILGKTPRLLSTPTHGRGLELEVLRVPSKPYQATCSSSNPIKWARGALGAAAGSSCGSGSSSHRAGREGRVRSPRKRHTLIPQGVSCSLRHQTAPLGFSPLCSTRGRWFWLERFAGEELVRAGGFSIHTHIYKDFPGVSQSSQGAG